MIARRRAWQQDDYATFPAIIGIRADKVAAAPGSDTSGNISARSRIVGDGDHALSIATMQM